MTFLLSEGRHNSDTQIIPLYHEITRLLYPTLNTAPNVQQNWSAHCVTMFVAKKKDIRHKSSPLSSL